MAPVLGERRCALNEPTICGVYLTRLEVRQAAPRPRFQYDPTMTPNELAKQLDVSPKTIRAFVREQYPEHEKNTRWVLNDDQATVVRARFSD